MDIIDERLIEINKRLKEAVENSYLCSMCKLNHNGICFFAYECLKNEHMYFLEEEND